MATNALRIPVLSARDIRVHAVLAGHAAVDVSWTEDDFAALAVAAADQAGASLPETKQIAEILGVEVQL